MVANFDPSTLEKPALDLIFNFLNCLFASLDRLRKLDSDGGASQGEYYHGPAFPLESRRIVAKYECAVQASADRYQLSTTTIVGHDPNDPEAAPSVHPKQHTRTY